MEQTNANKPVSTETSGATVQKNSSAGVMIASVVVLILVGLWALGRFTSVKVPGVPKANVGTEVAEGLQEQMGEEGEWQAVFLSNGQVYFGHMEDADGQFATLEEVYYLQVQQQQIQQAASATTTGQIGGVQSAAQPQLVLIKFGTELHGPEDFMKVNRDHILFWENLKPESTVVKSIIQYKQGQQSK